MCDSICHEVFARSQTNKAGCISFTVCYDELSDRNKGGRFILAYSFRRISIHHSREHSSIGGSVHGDGCLWPTPHKENKQRAELEPERTQPSWLAPSDLILPQGPISQMACNFSQMAPSAEDISDSNHNIWTTLPSNPQICELIKPLFSNQWFYYSNRKRKMVALIELSSHLPLHDYNFPCLNQSLSLWSWMSTLAPYTHTLWELMK